jgi:hypothetical protein
MAAETPTAPADGSNADAAAASDPWAEFAKNFPASESKPLSGATEVKDGAGYPAELVAYSLLDDVTSSITTALRRADAQRILLVEDRALLDSEWPYLTVTTQIDSLVAQIADAMDALKPDAKQAGAPPQPVQPLAEFAPALVPPALQLLAAAPKAVGAVADIIGMFRTNYTMASRTMSAKGTPMLAQVAANLRNADASVNVIVDSFATVSKTSPLLERIRRLDADRRELTRASVEVRARVATTTEQVAALKKDREATSAALIKVLADDKAGERLSGRLEELDARIAKVQSEGSRETNVVTLVDTVLAAVASFMSAALSAPPGGRAPLLAALARECIHLGEGGPSHVLFVSLDTVGADFASPASQLKDTKHVKYIGGMQVSFLLYSLNKGHVVAAGSERRVKHATLDLDRGMWKVDTVDELR